ncbi:MAG: hypothetical protein VZR36_08960 [Prevotella sp.]|nr:hypothetical protein [Prevotella sp.]
MAEIKIQIPEGYEGIDEEKSNFTEGRIVFKKKEVTPWRYTNPKVQGFFVAGTDSTIGETLRPVQWLGGNENVFATKKQAQSMRAMAQLSQIIQNDERFGGPLTDEEWNDKEKAKYSIERRRYRLVTETCYVYYCFLAFHTEEQAELFLKENGDMIRQYYMLD